MSALTPEQWFNLGGGLAACGLGLVVLMLRRTPPALAFVTFAMGAGAFYVVSTLVGGFGFPAVVALPSPLLWLATLLWASGTAAILLLIPRRLTRAELPQVLPATATGTVLAGVFFATTPASAYAYAGSTPTDELALRVGLLLLNAAYFPILLLYPLRVQRLGAAEGAEARSYAIIAIGFTFLAAGTVNYQDMPSALNAAANFAFILLPLFAWIYATTGAHAKLARNVVLISSGIFLVSTLLSVEKASFSYPVGRVLGFLFLGYAVMRGQVKGLDLKVRLALSKSTVAAIFIAVFFVASEAAQQFFGETLGSAYVGIAAAGALVFAIAPLQRAAERLAEAAVPAPPQGGATSGPAVDARETRYRSAVRLALRDRALTREEERALTLLALDLGIPAERAYAILDEEADDGRSHREAEALP